MFNCCGKCSMTLFLFSSNSVETLCVSWALPFNKRVRVWACKIRKPHTHVFVPMSHKAFLRDYWNPKELAANICRSPIISNSFFFYVSSYYSFNFLIRFIRRPHNFQKVVCCYDLKLICLIIFMQHLEECFIAHCFPQFIQE